MLYNPVHKNTLVKSSQAEYPRLHTVSQSGYQANHELHNTTSNMDHHSYVISAGPVVDCNEEDEADELDELDKLHSVRSSESNPASGYHRTLHDTQTTVDRRTEAEGPTEESSKNYYDHKSNLSPHSNYHHLENLLPGEPAHHPNITPLSPIDLNPIDRRQAQLLRYKPPPHTKRVLFIGTVALLGLAYLIVFFATKGTRYDHSLQTNVILMISDGFGPASETFAREVVQHIQNMSLAEQAKYSRWTFPLSDSHSSLKSGPSRNKFGTLPLDPLLIGSSRTRSSNSLITDSAAGATAFSCGIKSYNGAIAVEPLEQKPCGTILEAAKHRGYLTGLVATSQITDATPACFYSHVINRNMESNIASFLIGQGPLGRTIDLAFGGGRRYFLPNSMSASARSDDQDLFQIAQTKFGFTVINSTDQFEKLWDPHSGGQLQTPLLGLFNDHHMNYEIDRINLESSPQREPSLRNMSLAALQTLSKEAKAQSAHGFFLMIEGSRIDMAAHSNDPIGHLYDILAYQETVRTVQTWVDEANKAGWPTLMISVSDHETGGLTLGRQLTQKYPVYAWYPEVLLNATRSTASLAKTLSTSAQPIPRQFIVDEILRNGLGILDGSDEEINRLLSLSPADQNKDYLLADMISRRAQLGWSTHGHSGIDVNLYGYPPDLTKELLGNRENTEIGQFIAEAMQLDLDVVTRDLNRLSKSWHITDQDQNPNFQRIALDHYSHEF